MRWLVGFLLLVVVGTAGIFVFQNQEMTAQLQLDLGFAAWRTQPLPVVALAGGSLLAGFILGVIPMWFRGMRLAGQVRRLEQQVALSSTGQGSEDPW